MKARYWGAMLCSVPAGLHAAPPPVPGFWQLEAAYQTVGDPDVARQAVLRALPPGTTLGYARAALERAGATCRPVRADALKCLIHQYSLADGAADDIRWTIRITAPAAVIRDLQLDRYVDRHGSD